MVCRVATRYIDEIRNMLSGYNGDLYKHIEFKLDPNNNDFKLIKTSNFNSASGQKKEAWTDGECLMVRCDTVEDFIIKLYEMKIL